jgi:hemolysin III
MQHHDIAADGGPLYTETLNHLHSQSESWLVEPYNAASALLFVLVAVIWWWRLREQYGRQKFLLYGLVLLTIGGVGGTLYHALRTQPLYLLMDWMPIAVLALSLTYWFFMKQTRHRWLALLYAAGGLAFIVAAFYAMIKVFSLGSVAGSIGYSLIVLQATGPIISFLFKTKFRHAGWFFAGIAAFTVAAVFRATDLDGLLPMGTHFLWHVFGAVMAHLLLVFVYRVECDTAGHGPAGLAETPG